MLSSSSNEFQSAFIAAIPLFLAGIDGSFAANLNNLIQNKVITLAEESLVGSINIFARIIGAAGGGYTVDKIGRKNSILLSLCFSTTAWIIITYFSFNIEMLYIGRIFSGLAAGMRAIIILYISEIAHKSRRGKLLTFCGLFTSFGVSFTYFTQYYFSSSMVAVLALIISVFGFFQVLFLYETKYWLLMQNRPEEAQLSMLWFDDKMSEKEALEEIEEIQSQQQHFTKERHCCAVCQEWSRVKHLIICLLIFACRAATGRISIVAHPHNFYQMFALPVSSDMATLFQAILEVAASLLNVFIADVFPRKRMLHACCWTMIACLIISCFQVPLVNLMGIFGECIILLALMVFISLSCGFLMNLSTITVTEIASTVTEVRGVILSVCQIVNNFMNGIYASAFPFVLVSMPINYVLLFMISNLVLLSLMVTLVPETVGKALHKCNWEDEQEKELLGEDGGELHFEEDTKRLLDS